jgi:hypothetical protein
MRATADRVRSRRKRCAASSVCLALVALMAGIGLAQFRGDRRFDRGRRGSVDAAPEWQVDPDFQHDVFTFVRIRYGSEGGWGGGWGRRGRGSWRTDFPDSDLNFSYRLQQLTSLKVDPLLPRLYDKVIQLTDDALFDYPFIYIVEPGQGMYFEEEEATALRRYLLNGGFLMVDDFWGDYQWDDFYVEIKKVFPDREPEEVPLEHEIFHYVYDLTERPQIPSLRAAWDGRSQGITWEPQWGPNADKLHFKAIYDDRGRMMVFICHNTDLGDGWEREGEDEWYFREFSEKKAYPLGINIVVYAMTN